MSRDRLDARAVIRSAGMEFMRQGDNVRHAELLALGRVVGELLSCVDGYLTETARLLATYSPDEPIPGVELDHRRSLRDRMFHAFEACGGPK